MRRKRAPTCAAGLWLKTMEFEIVVHQKEQAARSSSVDAVVAKIAKWPALGGHEDKDE